MYRKTNKREIPQNISCESLPEEWTDDFLAEGDMNEEETNIQKITKKLKNYMFHPHNNEKEM